MGRRADTGHSPEIKAYGELREREGSVTEKLKVESQGNLEGSPLAFFFTGERKILGESLWKKARAEKNILPILTFRIANIDA